MVYNGQYHDLDMSICWRHSASIPLSPCRLAGLMKQHLEKIGP